MKGLGNRHREMLHDAYKPMKKHKVRDLPFFIERVQKQKNITPVSSLQVRHGHVGSTGNDPRRLLLYVMLS